MVVIMSMYEQAVFLDDARSSDIFCFDIFAEACSSKKSLRQRLSQLFTRG